MLRAVPAIIAAAAIAAIAAACSTTPQPEAAEIADACRLLDENRSWHRALRASAKEWGAPMGFQLAVVRQESAFDAKARPEREGGFLFFPGKRPSSARGYSQALDPTWEEYKQKTGNSGASRSSFRDSVDFIGWYFSNTGQRTGLGQYDYKAHYLAYHEGAGGYLRGTWRGKDWLVRAADRVASSAAKYETQIGDCDALKPKFLGIF